MAELPPAKTLSVQMSLTPIPLKSFLPGDSICGDTEGAACVLAHCGLQMRQLWAFALLECPCEQM